MYKYIYIYIYISTSCISSQTLFREDLVLRGTFTFPYFTLDSGTCGVVLSFNPSKPKLFNSSHLRVYFGELPDILNSSDLKYRDIYISLYMLYMYIYIYINMYIYIYIHTIPSILHTSNGMQMDATTNRISYIMWGCYGILWDAMGCYVMLYTSLYHIYKLFLIL